MIINSELSCKEEMMIGIIFAFAILVIWGGYRNKSFENPLLYQRTIGLRGLCAIEIMIGHIGLALSDEIILFPFRKAGILIVGIFFFLSGYGLMYSLLHKKGYLKHFLKKRVTVILIPLFLSCIFVVGVYVFLLNESFRSFKELVLTVFTSINWYVWEIMGCYILFFLLYRFFKKEVATISMCVVMLFFFLFCYFNGISNPWYGSTLCFVFGLIVGLKENEFLLWLQRMSVMKIGSVAILLMGSIAYFFVYPSGIFGAIVSRNISALCFVIIIFWGLQRITIGNVASKYLGKISFEIYLLHPVIINMLLRYRVKDNVFFAVLVIVLSVFCAVVLNQINKKIMLLMQKS